MPIAPFFILRFWSYARKVDLVDYHFPFPLVDVAIALWFPKKTKLVVHWHLDIVAQKKTVHFVNPFIKRTLARADSIIVASEYHISTSSVLGMYRDKCVIVPYGIEIQKWEALSGDESALSQQYRAQFPAMALFVGRLVPHKGLDTLLNAALDYKGHVVIVGSGSQEARLCQLADELGLTDRVHFIGNVTETELKALYHAADFLVFPSLQENEAFGLVQVEAMACGKPIINTRLASAVPWVARHGKEALTVAPGDVRALGKAMQRLANDTALRRKLGNNGYQRAQTLFGVRRFTQLTRDVYSAVLGEAGSRSKRTEFAALRKGEHTVPLNTVENNQTQ
jgi:glycosyltransferase involved in cell wall biosynthesis